MNVQLAGHHNYNGVVRREVRGRRRPASTISPDGTKLVVIGNFKTANGLARTTRACMVDLTGASAPRSCRGSPPQLTGACNTQRVRRAGSATSAFSPDGSYFVIVGTGGPVRGHHCATASSRWETARREQPERAADLGRLHRWRHLPVGRRHPAAVYVGGHFRWLNNSSGHDSRRRRRGRPGQHRRARPAVRPADGLEPGP